MSLRRMPVPLLFCLLATEASAQSAPPIGAWREHLPFNNALRTAIRGQKVLCATPYGFFTYDRTDKSFARLTRVNGLSEVRVRTMAAEPTGSRAAMVYRNGNVDIIEGERVRNIPDLMVSRVSGDKTVHAALWRGSELLLSTGLGIVVMDPDRREVRDTWRPSSNGSSIVVTSLAWRDGSYFAATGEGLKQAASTGASLADYRNWRPVATTGLTPGLPTALAATATSLALLKNDTVWGSTAQGWRILLAGGGVVTGLDATADRILVGQSGPSGGILTVIDAVTGTILARLQAPGLSLPRQAVPDGSDYWVADENNGLMRVTGNRAERIFPNSPINTAAGDLITFRGEVWAAAGAVNEAWNYTYNPNGLYRLKEGSWENINLYVRPGLDSLLDLVALAADPASGTVAAGSFGGGLLEIAKDGGLKISKQGTGLQETVGDPGSYRVAGLAYDRTGALWIANYGAPQDLVLKKKDGSWRRYTVPFLHNENAVSQIAIDDEGRKWIVSPKGNGLFCFDDAGTPDNLADDRWRFFRQGRGAGNLPSSEVRCVAVDRDGLVWIGTTQGVAVIPCVSEVFSSSCEAFLPIVQTDNFAGYLFAGEDVRCIAVDGANRKWVGTRNGVWLVDAEGTRVLGRFTEVNSPLLSNLVQRIAVDPVSGEVFFSTFNGICSFRGSATQGAEEAGSVLAFPNPVPPGYAGTIAIRGLPTDAIVRITEADGRLVYQTRALGGQAVWNGRNRNGEPAASGAYLVFVADDTGKGRLATRIFLVR
jgi:ligand-binding sensor domain-containing protein